MFWVSHVRCQMPVKISEISTVSYINKSSQIQPMLANLPQMMSIS